MKKKNIVFICTDQQRTDTLRAYDPNTLCRTPYLDALAEESVVFDRAYTSNPVCSPARCSMQTGLYPSKTGMESNLFQTGCRTHELQDASYLLSRRLQRAGYGIGYTGKWHLGFGKRKEESAEGKILLERMQRGYMEGAAYLGYGAMPTDVGYLGDDFPGHGNGGWAYPQFREYLKKKERKLVIEGEGPFRRPGDHSYWGEVTSGAESTIEYFLTDRGIELIEEMRISDKPFFLCLNFWGPHEPYFAPTQYLDLYRNMRIPESPSFRENPESMPRIYELLRRPEQDWSFFETARRYYYACTSHIDAQIGRLLAYLKEEGLYDETVILFAADHGDNQGCHGGLENKSYSMYDDTTRIPLFLKPARAGYKGYHQKAFAGTCDIYATILGQAQADPEGGYGDGRDLSGFIDRKDLPWENEIVTEGMGAFDVVVTQRMYRNDRYKYVFNGADRDQLFDMEKDPYEMDDLAGKKEYAVVLLELRNRLADWMEEHHDPIRNAFCKLNRIKEWTL